MRNNIYIEHLKDVDVLWKTFVIFGTQKVQKHGLLHIKIKRMTSAIFWQQAGARLCIYTCERCLFGVKKLGLLNHGKVMRKYMLFFLNTRIRQEKNVGKSAKPLLLNTCCTTCSHDVFQHFFFIFKMLVVLLSKDALNSIVNFFFK